MSTEIVPIETAAAFPTVRTVAADTDAVAQVSPVVALPRLLRLAQARAEWLGDQLSEQIAREGIGGVVGESMAVDGAGFPVKVSEYARQLAELEHRERVTAERLARDMLRLDLESRASQAGRDTGRLVVETLREFAAALGVPWQADATREAARSAITAVRRAKGFDVR